MSKDSHNDGVPPPVVKKNDGASVSAPPPSVVDKITDNNDGQRPPDVITVANVSDEEMKKKEAEQDAKRSLRNQLPSAITAFAQDDDDKKKKERHGQKEQLNPQHNPSVKGDRNILGTALKVGALMIIAPDVLILGMAVCAAAQYGESHRKRHKKPLKDLPDDYNPEISSSKQHSAAIKPSKTPNNQIIASKAPPVLHTAEDKKDINPKDLLIIGESLKETAKNNMPDNTVSAKERQAKVNSISEEKKAQAADTALSTALDKTGLTDGKKAALKEKLLHAIGGIDKAADLDASVADIASKEFGVPESEANDLAVKEVKKNDPAVLFKNQTDQKEMKAEEKTKKERAVDKKQPSSSLDAILSGRKPPKTMSAGKSDSSISSPPSSPSVSSPSHSVGGRGGI